MNFQWKNQKKEKEIRNNFLIDWTRCPCITNSCPETEPFIRTFSVNLDFCFLWFGSILSHSENLCFYLYTVHCSLSLYTANYPIQTISSSSSLLLSFMSTYTKMYAHKFPWISIRYDGLKKYRSKFVFLSLLNCYRRQFRHWNMQQ